MASRASNLKTPVSAKNLPPLLHDIPGAAARLGISRSLIYKLMNGGELPSIRLGNRRMIRETDIVAFVMTREGA